MTTIIPEKATVNPVGHPDEDAATRDRFGQNIKDLTAQAETKAAERQHAKGKNTARERITMLCDDGKWSEIDQFMGGDMSKGHLGCGVVTGFGAVGGREVAIYSQDFSVRGGSLGEVEGQKIVRLMKLAIRARIPIIGILDSGGARIQEGVTALDQYGQIFRLSCQASGFVPQISIVLGPCAGGAVYSPALTDFIIMTKENSHMFVTGPDVVKATTGEDVTFSQLGGGDIHNARSGVAHYLGEDEEDALDFAATLLTYLPANCHDDAPRFAYEPNGDDEARAHALSALVPVSPKAAYDVRDVVENIVDHGEFLEIMPLFAQNIVCGIACVNGYSVGVVANQPLVDAGTLDVDASEKAARFVRFCDAFRLPVLTLVDVPGYRPGTEQESAGIIRRGAKMISAYGNATVPLITLILRKAYGGAYIVMGSKSLGADLNFSWPDAQIAVMGADGAVSIMMRRELKAAIEAGEDPMEAQKRLAAEYSEEHINPNLSLSTGALDAVITPETTRSVLVRSLELLRDKKSRLTVEKYHDNMPL